ncbi:NAD(P)-dependent oxidoreductase [Mycolicibacterium pulveris]|uniref:NAD(P)-dependent oxidoreductase n=1 Tax=Mycolicibacterium pulveris TaxID=36813 RepID=UPI003CF8DD5E
MTHILDTAVRFVELVASTVDIAGIIAIPYSTTVTARDKLCTQFDLLEPVTAADMVLAANDAVRSALTQSAERTVIVQEIGGYCASQIAQLARRTNFGGVVEDTMQGHWRYQAIGNLACPVLTIAESPLKALENRQVGRAIAYSLETILRARFFRIPVETRIGVLGYGGIGEGTAASLAAMGARVSIYDPNPIRMARAFVEGLDVQDRETVLQKSDVVLGVSGQRSISADDVALLKDGAILCSGSSKRVEIDVDGLYAAADDVATECGLTRLMIGGKTLWLLNDGTPINFADQGVLGHVLDLVYTELYMCIRKLSEGACGPGLQTLEAVEQQAIAHVWRQIYA